jgi:capsule polysaccharide export protein KpsE/RkpR
MREIKDLASTIRGSVAKLRADVANATSGFAAEIANTQANIGRINSLKQEMSDANKEVEAMLADTGSNYEPQGKPDSNGVIVNKAK